MELANAAARTVARTVSATNAAAGAVSGAVVGGVLGSVKGAVIGIGKGGRDGARSAPAAMLTLAAVGAVGLVEWPVVLAVGGTGLAFRQLNSAPTPRATPTVRQPATRAVPAPRPPRRSPTRAAATT